MTTPALLPLPSSVPDGDACLSPSTSPAAAETLASFTAWAAGLFYLVEEGRNPSVRSYWDAFHYVATSLSVGYANVFPVTPAGKIIGAVVMMVGPALSARALDGAEVPSSPLPATDPALLDKLDAVLAELRALRRG